MSRQKLDEKTLLTDLKETAERVDEPLTATVYNEHGKFHQNTFRKYFGTWNKAKEAVDVDTISPNRSRGGKYTIKRRKEMLREIREELICELCNGDFRYPAMDFHHVEPSDKEESIARMPSTHTWAEIEEEMEKCVILCSNCHRELEAGLKTL